VISIFGKEYEKTELLSHVGDMQQIAGVRQVELVNGNERGVRALEFRTGCGLDFTLLQDRAMDIYDARFNGAPLAWISPVGPVAPSFYEYQNTGWLRSFPGGLLTTCGLTQVGEPAVDNGEELGLHGRISNIPAKNVAWGAEWDGDDYVIWATGEIRETRVFGPNLLLQRSVHARLGEPRILIKDVIENQGYEDAPIMVLYHCNIGFPVVCESTELLAVINDVQASDDDAEQGLDKFDRFQLPEAGYKEQVFFIDHDYDENGIIKTALVNRSFDNNHGLGIYLSYSQKELPHYTQWKMMGKGTYVVGMEPGNCIPEGRVNARERGVLEMLQPREQKTIHLEIGVLTSNGDIRAFESMLRGTDG